MVNKDDGGHAGGVAQPDCGSVPSVRAAENGNSYSERLKTNVRFD